MMATGLGLYLKVTGKGCVYQMFLALVPAFFQVSGAAHFLQLERLVEQRWMLAKCLQSGRTLVRDRWNTEVCGGDWEEGGDSFVQSVVLHL